MNSEMHTAFVTPRGLFAWGVMAYGLRNSATTFQRIMNEVLQVHMDYACACIDAVAVYSESGE